MSNVTVFIGDSVTDCDRLTDPPFGNGYVLNIARSGRLAGEIINVETSGQSSYYPIGVDNERFLFTRVQDSHHDGIRWGYYDGRKSTDLFFNNDTWDSSDSYPYQDAKDFIFLVSGDVNIPKGGYNLVIADLKRKKVVNIDDLYGDINSHQQELGPAWTSFTYTK